jgi:hypothetical protein
VERLDFRDQAPEVIDLSPEGGVVKMLKESMIDCVMSDKVGWTAKETKLETNQVGSLPLLFPPPIPWSITGICRFHRRYQTFNALV